MLRLLHIENIAVIEQADIEFEDGMIVMSGETGAGKSIIIDALGAALGMRMSRELLRQGAAKGSVNAVFSALSAPLKALLAELDLTDEESDELQIVRQISAEGKNTCRVNMKPVTVSVLKTLAPFLIDIYGQNDGQKLLNEKNHLQFLDMFAKSQGLLDEYTPLYASLRALKKQITQLDNDEAERLRQIDLLTFQKEELALAKLDAEEEARLNARKQLFDGQAELASALHEAVLTLAGDDDTVGVVAQSETVAAKLAAVADYAQEVGALAEKTQELAFLAEEIRARVHSFYDVLDFSPQEQELTEARLDELYQLKRKYGKTIPELMAYESEVGTRLEALQHQDETRAALRVSYRETLAVAKETAAKLSAHRAKAAKDLEARVVEQLRELDMAKVQFSVQLMQGNKLSATGADGVAFLISVNPGEALKPLSKVASGGELSRIMLAMKNVLTADEDVGMLVFDEIDTGVSGSAAQKIAQKLSDIGAKKQTLCVTHLPQIAAMGDYHLHITKAVREERSYTSVQPLGSESRIEEIARMISGQTVTETSKKNAEELLSQAAAYKEGIAPK